MKDVKSKVIEICNKSKIASYSLSEKKNSERNKALKIIANDILKNKIKILNSNNKDYRIAKLNKTPSHY